MIFLVMNAWHKSLCFIVLGCDIRWQTLRTRTKLDGQYQSRICGQPTLHFQVSFMCVQRLALFSCFTAMELDTTHISGPRNELADGLSRWNGKDALPDGLNPAFRFPWTFVNCGIVPSRWTCFRRIVRWTGKCRRWSFCTELQPCFGPPHFVGHCPFLTLL